MNTPLPEYSIVSIITPSYNQGRFIEDTIKSVLSQEGDFFLEYIIIDGGSKDDSIGIIRKYDRLLKEGGWPVKCRGIEYSWVSERDRGQSEAINKGFRMAKGGIVAWLNSDDTYLPGAINKAVAFFESNSGVMMVYGEGYEMDERGKLIGRFHATEPFELGRLIYLYDYILQPTVFMRKGALEEAGFLDESLHWCMDWDLWIRIGKRFRVDYIPDFLASSRVYGETKTSTGGGRRLKEISALMRRHGGRRFPPGYFYYARGTLEETLKRRAPSALRFFLNPVVFLVPVLFFHVSRLFTPWSFKKSSEGELFKKV